MKYTKEDLKQGNFFIIVEDNQQLRDFLVEEYHISKGSLSEITSLDIGKRAGFMCDTNGEYYKQCGYTQVFPEELTFLNPIYEIY